MQSKRGERPRSSDLVIVGYPCIIAHDDDTVKVDQTDLLLKWHESDGKEILIDRYDIRNYFEYDSLFKQLGDPNGDECDDESLDEEEVLCEKWKYKDLVGLSDSTESSEIGSAAHSECRSKVPWHRGRDSDGEIRKHAQRKTMHPGNLNRTRAQESIREPEPDFDDESPACTETIVVNGMLAPKCERLRKILHKTALFVRNSANPQVEVLIRVNQQDNADLSFMHHSDKFHAYYNAVKNGEVTLDEEDSSPQVQDKGASSRDRGTVTPSEAKSETKEEPPQYASNYAESSGFVYGGYPEYYHWGPYVYPGASIPAMPTVLQEKTKTIIEKVANFVAKNGLQFEETVRKRQLNNPDFVFLDPQNELHGYYRYITGKIISETKPVEDDKAN